MSHGASQQTKQVYLKGYMPNWTDEHFTLSQAMRPKKGQNADYIS